MPQHAYPTDLYPFAITSSRFHPSTPQRATVQPTPTTPTSQPFPCHPPRVRVTPLNHQPSSLCPPTPLRATCAPHSTHRTPQPPTTTALHHALHLNRDIHPRRPQPFQPTTTPTRTIAPTRANTFLSRALAISFGPTSSRNSSPVLRLLRPSIGLIFSFSAAPVRFGLASHSD